MSCLTSQRCCHDVSSGAFVCPNSPALSASVTSTRRLPCLLQYRSPLLTTYHRSTTAAGVPRLFDLVRPAHPSLAVAFYYGLRNTLVAADLEQASRIAYGKDRRWGRVVTLEVRGAL